MENERIIERVKKILALAENNPFQEEAETAMLKAQELLIAHGLTMAQVGDRKTKQDVIENGFYVTRVVEQWMGMLLNVVADHARCKAFWNRHRNGYNSFEYRAVFIGTEDDAAVAGVMYQYAFKVIKELSKKYAVENSGGANHKKLMASYSVGFVTALNEAYRKQVEDKGWALALIPSEEVVEQFESHNMKKVRSKGREEDYHAYAQGNHDGKNFNINGHSGELEG